MKLKLFIMGLPIRTVITNTNETRSGEIFKDLVIVYVRGSKSEILSLM